MKRGKKFGSGTKGKLNPRVSPFASSTDTIQALLDQGYVYIESDFARLSPKGETWARRKLESMGLAGFILLEAYICEQHGVILDRPLPEALQAE